VVISSRQNFVLSQISVDDRLKRTNNDLRLLETKERMESSTNEEVINYLGPIFLNPDPRASASEKDLLSHLSFAARCTLMEFLEKKCHESHDFEKEAHCLLAIMVDALESLKETFQTVISKVRFFFFFFPLLNALLMLMLLLLGFC